MSHAQKAIAVADKVVTMAEGALAGLETVTSQWPGEFRAIVWDAVADIASRRAQSARETVSPPEAT